MRIKHNQLDGLFVYQPIPFGHLIGTWFLLRMIGCLGTLYYGYLFKIKLLKWGVFQLCSTLSFLVNRELLLKFTGLSVLMTIVTEIVTQFVAYSKCSSEQECNIELSFIGMGILYSVGSVGMIYKILFPSCKKT